MLRVWTFSRQIQMLAIFLRIIVAKRKSFLTALFLTVVSIAAVAGTDVYAVPGDYAWQPAGTSGMVDVELIRPDVATSNDGTKLVVTDYAGYIYTSTDSGATWTERTSAGARRWSSIASSADGEKLAVAVGGWSSTTGYIYTSTDSGATWTERTSAGAREWFSVASSADGTKLVAGARNGYIYTSTDSGATWTERTSAGISYWVAIKSSADGSKLLAGGEGPLRLSTDSGATWTQIPGLNPNGAWNNIAMTPDGSTMIAADSYGTTGSGGLTYISNDGGVTWNQVTDLGTRYWNDTTGGGAAVSADGKVILLADMYGGDWNGGHIYQSLDGGETWAPQPTDGSLHSWTAVASSSDGAKLFAVASFLPIYLATKEPPATDTVQLNTVTSPTDIDEAIQNAQLSITSETCYEFTDGTISLHGPSDLTAPEKNIDILGGIGFSVACAVNGGAAPLTLSFGAYYADTTKLRAYKLNSSTQELVDITDQVTFENTGGSGSVTSVKYTLVDGGAFDEDGVENGTIVDPVYIGAVAGTTSAQPGVPNTGIAAFSRAQPLTVLVTVTASTVASFWALYLKRRS